MSNLALVLDSLVNNISYNRHMRPSYYRTDKKAVSVIKSPINPAIVDVYKLSKNDDKLVNVHTSGLSTYRFLSIPSNFEQQWQTIVETIIEWPSLKRDWDGEEGVPPTHEQVKTFSRFAERAWNSKISPGKLYIAGDGEIGMRWHQDRKIATISYLNDARFFAYCPRVDRDAVSMDCTFLESANDSMFLAAVAALR